MFGGDDGSSNQDAEILADLQAQLGSTGDDKQFEDSEGSPAIYQVDKTNDGDVDTEAPLSKEDAEDLQRRLDNLSDDQIEKVFSKMRGSLSSKMVDDLESNMKSGKDEIEEAIQIAKLAKATSNAPPRKLPKTEALDPEIRKKYDRELNAIEEELEKMYNDPLGVWQELITDPDKYLSDEEIKKIDGDQEMQQSATAYP